MHHKNGGSMRTVTTNNKMWIKYYLLVALGVLMITPTFCDIDLASTMTKIIDSILLWILYLGVAVIIAGVVKLALGIYHLVSGNSSVNELAVAFGLVIGGVIMCSLKSVLNSFGITW